MNLPDKILVLHQSLTRAGLPHAFGGALALAWCTRRARGTIDIDINIFVTAEQCDQVLAALPAAIEPSNEQRRVLQRDGQVRLWWEQTPVDIFLNSTDFHPRAQERVRWETFLDHTMPFLACNDIAVFKVFFNRTRDWADLEAMHDAGTLKVQRVIAVLTEYLGPEDERIARLRALNSETE